MIKKLFIFLFIVAIGVGIWVAFALWSGLYSIYSFPPSKGKPEGATLLVTRDAGEPMFNSPAYQPPKPKAQEGGGIGFSQGFRSKRPLVLRTVVTLPYIEWAYKKSLEKHPDE